MLTHLHIKHFAIIDSTELEFTEGLTALTGETGAGKSILLDALGLVLGARASVDSIQQGASRADVTAVFSLESLPWVCNWLDEQELGQVHASEEEQTECLIRRTISATGKSRATINDIPVSVNTLRALGLQLVSIHGQHAYQTLTRSTEQRELLDNFAGSLQLSKVTAAFEAWKRAETRLRDLTENSQLREQRADLLRFQLQEFDDLDMGNANVADIESEHRWLASSERIMALSEQALALMDDTAYPALHRSIPSLTELVSIDERLRESLDLIESACIQVAESSQQIRSAMSNLEHDDSRLAWLDQKLAALHRLSRKHQCKVEDLPEIEVGLRNELDDILDSDLQPEALLREVEALRTVYGTEADKLTRHRRKHAKVLGETISQAMQGLNMTGGVFKIQLSLHTGEPRIHGNDDITFLVSPNPGVAPAPLSKVASGGELSRISLCLQLASIGSRAVPTLIFDEVDTGVGGAVAENVGKLLRQVGTQSQVLCVTHLPQVAAQAHQHLKISKYTTDKSTRTVVEALDAETTLEEIARMLGGTRITAKTRQHAQEMLDSAESLS